MKRVHVLALVSLVSFVTLTSACGGDPPPVPIVPRPVASAPPPAPTQTSEPARVTPDAPFRENEPAAGPAVPFVPPKIASFALKNGVKVLFVERHDLPIVNVELVVRSSPADAGGKISLATFTGAMMEQGAGSRDAIALSDAFEAIGASHGAWFDWDAGGASVKVTTGALDQALDLLADVALRPTFPAAEVERLRARRLAEITDVVTRPYQMADNAAAKTVFGPAHPYGHPQIGEEADVKAITRDAIVRTYHAAFAPNRAAILVCGDVTKDALAQKLEARFGAWKGAAQAIPPIAKPPAPKAGAPRLVLVNNPNAPQSQVLFAGVGVDAKNKDRDAIEVMNTVLGGMFSSRINMNLREKNAFTYGARSYFAERRSPGAFVISSAIKAAKTAPAIHEIYTELEKIRDEAPSDTELDNAKQHILLSMSARFESVSSVTGALWDVFVYDLPIDEWDTMSQRISAITADDVKRVAVTYLAPRSMKVIVVGDRKTLEPAMEVLRLGAPDVRDAFGNPIANPPKDAASGPAKP